MKGVKESALVDLGNIDRTPVSIVIGSSDEICLVEYAQRHYDLMTTPEKYIRYEDGDHGMPYRTDKGFMERFVQTIETGSQAKQGMVMGLATLSTLMLAIQI